VTVTHNVVHDVGDNGIAVNCTDNPVISYNEIYHSNQWKLDSEWGNAALGKFAFSKNSTVIGNWVHDTQANAIWYDVYSTNAKIENNHVGPNNRSGIFYEISYNAVISGNLIERNGAFLADSPGNPGAGLRISSSGWSEGPGAELAGKNLPGPKGILINNNTLNGNHIGIDLYDGHGSRIPVNNVSVTGNKVTSTDSGSTAYAGYDGEPSGQGNSFDNNAYTLRQNLFYTAGPGNTNFSGWRRIGLDPDSTCTIISGGSC
jgi:hypothetical protein